MERPPLYMKVAQEEVNDYGYGENKFVSKRDGLKCESFEKEASIWLAWMENRHGK
jgi:hypothetical protein